MLRPYQLDSINRLRGLYGAGNRRLVLVAPTGAGKSVIAHEVIRSALERKKRIGFLVHRKQLVRQFSQRLSDAGIAHGILRGDETDGMWRPCFVGSIQTAARRGVPPIDLMLIDEAHAVPGSKDYRELIEQHTGAVLGLTATPWARGMAEHFEGSVIAANYSELIASGCLVDCDVFAPSDPVMTGIDTARKSFGESDWTDAGAARAMKPLTGDVVSHWLRHSNGRKTVVFACTIDHSKDLVAQFQACVVAAEHLDAYTSDEDRAATLGRLRSGETMLVSCVSLLAEGFDEPSLETMVLARPTKSLIRYIQMVGRVLRPHPGKQRALVLDHSGTVLRLGFPTIDRDYDLDDGSAKSASKADDTKPEIKPCPECKFVPARPWITCPSCGFVKTPTKREIAVEDDDLVVITKADGTTKQRFYSELLSIARQRGRSTGWVAHTYRAKFGVWPRGLDDCELTPTHETLGYVRHRNIAWARRADSRAD